MKKRKQIRMFLKQVLISWVLLMVSEVANGEVLCNSAHHFFETCLGDSDISNSTKAFLRQSKIPFNNEEIQDYCNIFQRGIRCFQDYADKCISDPAKLRLLEGEVMPAKNFHEMLCKDKMFREDYLSHGKCFQFVEKDWETCTNLFHEVLNKEFTRVERERKSNINTQYMHFCCARYSYAKCVGNSAKAKCKPESAKFTKALIELLSNERQFKNCARIEKPLCSTAASHGKFHYRLFCFMFLALILNALDINV